MDPMAIHRAVKEGDLLKVRQLMEAGASLDSRDYKGRTPLLRAAQLGHHEVVEFLISCKLNPENRKPLTSLDTDVEDEGAMGLFLQHDEENNTLLHFASTYGWVDIAQTIIGKGTELDLVNATTKGGMTPLMEAAFNGQEDVAALLLRSGADVNRSHLSGYTALHWAALNDQVSVVQLFLQEEGLDLNPQDLRDWTPLHVACFWGLDNEAAVIKQLLVAGADPNLTNWNRETPLSIYLELHYLVSLEVINLFVQHGAFFQDGDYSIMINDSVLKENVLKNVDLPSQSVINKFNYQTLPVLNSCPYFTSKLPSLKHFKLNTSQEDEVKNFVRLDIQQNTFCNVARVRPTALSSLCIQCLAAYITSRT